MALKLSSNSTCITSRKTALVQFRKSTPRVVCSASKDEESSSIALPLASLVAVALLTSSFTPDEAWAGRSGGRVGGGGGGRGAAMRSAPARSAPAPSMTQSRTYNSYTAPTVIVAPSMGYGYGGGFMPIMPSFGFGFFPLGGFLQIFLVLAVVSVVFSAISGAASKLGGKKDGKEDEWGDL